MNRLLYGLVSGSAVLCSCTERDRPDPIGPDSLALSAVVLEPQTSATVVAGATIDVRVHAAEPASRLLGVGFLARFFGSNAPPLDSAAVRFPAVADTTHVFSLQVPADLATNTQIDISGLAFGPTRQTARSSPQSIVVIACPGGGTGCR
jgi:hypothetical protein